MIRQCVYKSLHYAKPIKQSHTLFKIILIFSPIYAHASNAVCSSQVSLPNKILYVFLIALMRATCPAYLIFLDMITLILFGRE